MINRHRTLRDTLEVEEPQITLYAQVSSMYKSREMLASLERRLYALASVMLESAAINVGSLSLQHPGILSDRRRTD